MAAPTITSTPFAASNATVYTWNGSSVTQSYTHVSGDDLFVWWGGSYDPREADPTGVTWNGTALTKIANLTHPSVASLRGTLWRLAAASGTTQNVVVTWGSSNAALGALHIFSANGVVSLGTAVTSSSAFSGVAAQTVTLAGDSNSLMFAALCMRKDPYSTVGALTGASNGTDIGNTEGYANNACDRTVTFTKAGGASVAMTVTLNHTDVNYGVMVGIPLQGAGGGGGALPARAWLL